MRTWFLSAAIMILTSCAAPASAPAQTPSSVRATATTVVPRSFDGTEAMQYLVAQMNIGPRPAGSSGDRATGDYILQQLNAAGWKAVTQEFTYRGVAVRNVIGMAAEGRGPAIILGAHYDTRKRADQDKLHPDQPVPGANDGASGVAVLLELARTVDVARLKNEVWLAFFDAEDDGDLSGCIVAPAPCDSAPWPWSVGASYVADHLDQPIQAVIVLDMICDKDQNIYYEQNSDADLMRQIWGIAGRLGYAQQFIPQYKWSMEDDHTPFLQKKVQAVDVIDFDYPYWHTTEDTTDKCSTDSLGRVGSVMQAWLEGR